MTYRSLAFALAAMIAFAAPKAQAATVDFTGNHYNMGLVEIGDVGTIATNSFYQDGGYKHDYARGLLPSNAAITFTYTFSAPIGEWDYVQGEAAYRDPPYRYRVAADSNGWTLNQEALQGHGFHDTTDVLDVSVSALMAPDRLSGTVTITNLADVAANFASYFLSYCHRCSGIVSTTYAVSSVPLPAALPLFGLGLAGLAGYRLRKKAIDAAA